MRECASCGQLNPEDAEFCENSQCRTYLGWATGALEHPDPAPAPTAAAPRLQSPRPVAPAPASHQQRAGVRVTVEPGALSVDPGSVAVTTVTVHNTGTRVEEFELGVGGAARPFAHLEPSVLSVYPDAKATAVLRFAPPRDPRVRAGREAFVVGARSRVDASVSASASGTLTVGAFSELEAALRPESTRGRKPARHVVRTTNVGNVPLGVQLQLTDRDSALTFAPPQAITTLAPGATAETPVLVSGARKIFGRTDSHAFIAQVTPADGGAPIGLNGVRHQVPMFPWWIPTAAAVVLALLLAVVALWPGTPPSKVPGTSGETQLAATEKLVAAGYTVVEIRKADPNIAPGSVIATDPPGGAVLDKGNPVQLIVSTGPCQGPCDSEVPNLAGLTVAEAQSALEKVELKAGRQILEPSATRAKDEIISSTPLAGQKAPRGSTVDVTVSTGAPNTGGASTTAPTTGGGPGGGESGGGAGGGGNAEIEVPDVVGKTKDEAEAAIVKAGLRANAEDKADDKVAAGKVIGTKPAAKTKVAKDSEVKVEVSTGPGQLAVPEVAGKSKDEAVAAITKAGLKAKLVDKPDDGVAAGKAIGTEPAATTKVAKGSEVTLTVSTGPAKVPVPDVAGKTRDEALAAVAKASLEPTAVPKPDDKVAAGKAIGTNPAAKTPVAKESAVQVFVSVGPPVKCKSGYVLRFAKPDDQVCVTPEAAARAKAENAAAESRKNPNGAYGPNSCVAGYVWREAFDGDTVCVTPDVRAKTKADTEAHQQHAAP